MTRGVLLAWIGAGVAVAAILAALLWPIDASVAPLPTAGTSAATGKAPAPPSTIVPPVVAAAPVEKAVTTDARGRVVRQPKQVGAVPAARVPAPAIAAPPAAAAPAAARAAASTTDPPTTTTPVNGGRGGGLFPGGGNGGFRQSGGSTGN